MSLREFAGATEPLAAHVRVSFGNFGRVPIGPDVTTMKAHDHIGLLLSSGPRYAEREQAVQ